MLAGVVLLATDIGCEFLPKLGEGAIVGTPVRVAGMHERSGGRHPLRHRHQDLVVRLPDRQRTDVDALANTLIPTATGSVLPLNRVAQVVETEGPATINREWGKRRITVQCNVRGRDVGSFVAERRRRSPPR
jgi:Cu/Ag efflux pump CusA